MGHDVHPYKKVMTIVMVYPSVSFPLIFQRDEPELDSTNDRFRQLTAVQ